MGNYTEAVNTIAAEVRSQGFPARRVLALAARVPMTGVPEHEAATGTALERVAKELLTAQWAERTDDDMLTYIASRPNRHETRADRARLDAAERMMEKRHPYLDDVTDALLADRPADDNGEDWTRRLADAWRAAIERGRA